MHNCEGSNNDQYAFKDGREVFGFVVTVGMVLVRRLGTVPNRDQRYCQEIYV